MSKNFSHNCYQFLVTWLTELFQVSKQVVCWCIVTNFNNKSFVIEVRDVLQTKSGRSVHPNRHMLHCYTPKKNHLLVMHITVLSISQHSAVHYDTHDLYTVQSSVEKQPLSVPVLFPEYLCCKPCCHGWWICWQILPYKERFSKLESAIWRNFTPYTTPHIQLIFFLSNYSYWHRNNTIAF